MALTLKTDTYISLEDCDQYHTAYGNSEWPETPAEGVDGRDAIITAKEAAIRKGSRFLDANYAGRWRGKKAASSQKMAWPRKAVYDDDGYLFDSAAIPDCVADAAAEAALRAYSGDLLPDLERGGKVASEAVGDLSVSYFEGASGATEYPLIDGLLSDVIVSRGELARG